VCSAVVAGDAVWVVVGREDGANWFVVGVGHVVGEIVFIEHGGLPFVSERCRSADEFSVFVGGVCA